MRLAQCKTYTGLCGDRRTSIRAASKQSAPLKKKKKKMYRTRVVSFPRKQNRSSFKFDQGQIIIA